MESLAATSNVTSHPSCFPHFVRPEIPGTLPILARLEDERALLEQAVAAFRAEVAAELPAVNAA